MARIDEFPPLPDARRQLISRRRRKRFGALGLRLNLLKRRIFSRGNEVALILLGIVGGALAGLVVSLLSTLSRPLQHLFFGIPFGTGLSGAEVVQGALLVTVPVLGGLVSYALIKLRRRRGNVVDPVEANALYGGASERK